MAIRPPHPHSQGFTLIEMIVTVMVAGILMGIAVPSLLSLSKPLRDGSLQFKSQINLIRSKAIASGKAYRIIPKSTKLTDYPGGVVRNFVVEYAANCKKDETAGNWQRASQFDLDLPPNIGIPDTAPTLPDGIGTVPNSLDWNELGKRICFDNRGLLDNGTFENTTGKIVLKDFQGFNKAKLAALTITKVGDVDINAYSASFTRIVKSGGDDPDF